LRNADDIKNAYHFFIHKQASFLVSCYRYAWMNPWWAVTLNHENKPTWIFDKEKKRSQDLPPLFSPTGAIWIAKVESLKRDKTFYGQEHIFWEMDWKRALDIDNVEDIKLGLALRNVGN
jgi:N-acylneuraminate cytidylyltransferase